jgi:hypothetical protein
LGNYSFPNTTFEFFPTYQTLNLLNIPQLLKFMQRYPQVSHKIFNDVKEENGLKFCYIPDALRKRVIDLYETELQKKELNSYYSNVLTIIINQLKQSHHDPALFSQSIEWLKKQDQYRGIKACDYLPEFCDLIAKDGYYL